MLGEDIIQNIMYQWEKPDVKNFLWKQSFDKKSRYEKLISFVGFM